MTGKYPTNLIDHRDNNRSNNAFSNIREASKSKNACNSTKLLCSNSSGYVGVWFNKKSSLWEAEISKYRVKHRLGSFSNPREAAIARDKAAIMVSI